MIVCEEVDVATGRPCADPARWRVWSGEAGDYIGDGANVCSAHVIPNLDPDETNHVIVLDPCHHGAFPAEDCALCRDPFIAHEEAS